MAVNVQRSAESAELTPRITVIFQMVPQGEMMLEYGLRFFAGGIAVSAFAALGDTFTLKASRACSAPLRRLHLRRFS